ncbi:MAG: CPBP family intramembrane metalloprotease [Oscillospiraceae bacterium]|nr:CPBP family intramembrane metalloprotease [Oscillospiraceae bacterium]
MKFLYAVDVYLLYLLSGIASAAGVVVYYSIRAAIDYGNIGEIADAPAFAEYISGVVAGKASLVLLVSYCIVVVAVIITFAIRRKSLSAYAGLSYGRFISICAAAILGAVLNLLTYSVTPDTTQRTETVNLLLVLCVMLGPFVEELMFRGVLLKMFGAACGTVTASFITAALFAMSHTEPVQMLYTFVLGIILAAVRVKSTSLWSPLALHLSFNITGAVMMVAPRIFSHKAMILLGIAAVLLFLLSCTGGRTCCTSSEKAK